MIVRLHKKLLGQNFYAINLFGIIIAFNELSKVEQNHELIHTAQAKELLYIPFYIWYVFEWIILTLKYKDGMKAYYNIRFEKEAYSHQSDLDYLKNRKHYNYL